MVCRRLLATGTDPATLAGMTLADAPPTADRERLRGRRAELGLPADDASPLVVDPVTGDAVGVADLPLHLRRAQMTRVGVEANTGICRGMLRHRYRDPSGEGQLEEDR